MSRLQPREVLIVEDETLIRIVAADALADSGVMAWEAGDATEALQMLHDHPQIGLIFTDVNMPGDMDGIALANVVHEDRPEVALIVTSGKVHVPDSDLPDHGTFLPKPYHTTHLIDVVQRKLDEAGRAA